MLQTIIILAVSLSIDALGIGISYGIRKIKVPLYAFMIVSTLAFLFSATSIALGSLLLVFLPKSVSVWIGVVILICMGVWIIYQGLKTEQQPKPKKEKKEPKPINIFIKSLGITIKIIRTPESCDLDRSNSIDPLEAVYLGIALSIDSFGAGIGSAVMGLNSISIPVAVVLFQILFLSSGLLIGKKISFHRSESNVWVVISGSLLIVLALTRLFLS